MKLYVTRHGQSQTNADKLLVLNHDDNPLTFVGVEQARAYGAKLLERRANLTHVFSSPLLRARQTTMEITKVLYRAQRSTPYARFDEHELRELDWVQAPGDTTLEPTRDAPIHHKPLVIPAKRLLSAESQLEVYDRVIARLKAIIVALPDDAGDVLIVTHHFPVKAIRAFVEHGDPNKMTDFFPENLCDLVYDLDALRGAPTLA